MNCAEIAVMCGLSSEQNDWLAVFRKQRFSKIGGEYIQRLRTTWSIAVRTSGEGVAIPSTSDEFDWLLENSASF